MGAMETPWRPPTAPARARDGLAGEYEWRTLALPRDMSRSEVRRMLAEHAEYGRWELARVRVSFGGSRRVWLRRKIIRVERTA